MKKDLFICATPFHILNAINFTQSRVGENSFDMIILPDIDNCEIIAEKLIAFGLFENVFVLNEKDKSYTKGKSFLRLLLGSDFLRKILRNKSYDNTYYSLTNPVLHTLISREIEKYNRNVKHFFMEDGIGTYTNYLERITPRMRILYKVLGKTPISENSEGVYFYRPEVVVNHYNCEYLTLPSLGGIRENLDIINKINSILGYRGDLRPIDDVVLYLTQPLAQDGIVNITHIESKVLSILATGGLKPTIKLHPRMTRDLDLFLGYDVVSGFPIELITLNDSLSNKILVTPFSTAAVTPKLIFDEEPFVVFLYKLFHLDNLLPQIKIIEKLVMSVRSKYSDPDRIQIPSSWDELTNVVEKCVLIKRKVN